MNFWKKALSAAAAVLMTAIAAHAISTTAVDRLIGAGTTAPVVSACGTGALGTGSSDFAGDVTATGATGCTLTFGQAFATAPSCTFTNLTVPSRAYTVTVSATAIVFASLTAADKVAYICVGKGGG